MKELEKPTFCNPQRNSWFRRIINGCWNDYVKSLGQKNVPMMPKDRSYPSTTPRLGQFLPTLWVSGSFAPQVYFLLEFGSVLLNFILFVNLWFVKVAFKFDSHLPEYWQPLLIYHIPFFSAAQSSHWRSFGRIPPCGVSRMIHKPPDNPGGTIVPYPVTRQHAQRRGIHSVQIAAAEGTLEGLDLLSHTYRQQE